MGGSYLKHILFGTDISVDIHTCGSSCSLGTERSKTALLNAGIHVRLVIVADVDDVVIAVDSAGKSLNADIGSTSVAGESDSSEVLVTLCPQTRLHACKHGSSTRERGNYGVIGEAKLREIESHGRHTARRKNRNGILSEDLQRSPYSKTASAARTGFMSVEKLLA